MKNQEARCPDREGCQEGHGGYAHHPYREVRYPPLEAGGRKPRLDFYNCLRLLDVLITNGLLKKDPTDPDKSRILVYREASVDCPEGWYSENVHETAGDLAEDADGQEFLLSELEKRGIEFHEEKLRRADQLFAAEHAGQSGKPA